MAIDVRPALPEGQLAALRAAYAEPPRAYHDFAHVEAVMGQYDLVAAGPGWARPGDVRLAVLYHDAVHVPGRRDNEQKSAALAVAEIRRWGTRGDVDPARVAELILLTARHGAVTGDELGNGPDGDDARLFLDCDMAILGADPATFDAYDRGIAEEYRGRVPALVYRHQRRRFLAGLLAKPRIYLSDFFHARLDVAARSNLRRATGDGA